jgi:hypothetical protein
VHLDRCAECQGQVEEALAAHFGRPVPLRLVVDDGSPAIATATGSDTASDAEPEEAIDLADLVDAPADDRSGVDKLTDAFPGAQLLDGD